MASMVSVTWEWCKFEKKPDKSMANKGAELGPRPPQGHPLLLFPASSVRSLLKLMSLNVCAGEMTGR